MTEIRNLVMALMLLSGVTIGMTSFTGAMFTEYNIQNPSNLNSFNLVKNITSTMESSKTKLYEKGIDQPDIITVIWSFGANAINALTLMFSTGALYQNIISDTVNILHLENWVSTVVYGAILVLITFAFISAFMKWRV